MSESETPESNKGRDGGNEPDHGGDITDADIAAELQRLRQTLGPHVEPGPQPPTEEQIAVVERMQARREATLEMMRRARADQAELASRECRITDADIAAELQRLRQTLGPHVEPEPQPPTEEQIAVVERMHARRKATLEMMRRARKRTARPACNSEGEGG